MQKIHISKLILLTLFLLSSQFIKAQFVSIGGEPTGPVPCDTTLTLSAIVSSGSGTGNGTDSYAVSSVPYIPFSYTGANVMTPVDFGGFLDDRWSNVIPLPFTFCYFGNSYTSCVISQNGQIGFDLSQANTFSPYSTVPIPSNNPSLNNTIMGTWCDLYPFNSGWSGNRMNWDVYGVAPNRKFVVSWNDNPLFSCTSILVKMQIVLYEGSNIIEVNISNKPTCGGGFPTCVEGIQNSTASLAYTAPGRNSTAWTANNDCYRFTPSGTAITINPTYTWIDSATGVILGTNSTLTLTPPVLTRTIILNITAPGACAQLSGSDTAHIESGIIADFSFNYGLGCTNDTVTFTNLTSPSLGNTYTWNFGDGGTSNQANPQHIYLNQGVYNVRLISNHPPCPLDTIIKTITINHPLDAGFTQDKISVCENDPVLFIDTSIGGIVTRVWTLGDGTTINNQTTFSHTYLAFGTYTVKLVVTDTLGCKDSATVVITNNQPFANFAVTKRLGCDRDTVLLQNLSDTLSALQYVWSFPGGSPSQSTQMNPNPVLYFQGINNITLYVINGLCRDTVTKPVDLNHPLEIRYFTYRNNDVNFPLDSICLSDEFRVNLGASDPFNEPSVIVNIFWGDGTTNTTTLAPPQDPRHFYPQPGLYTLKIIITDTLGCKDSISKVVFVDNLQFERITASTLKACIGEPILFTDSVAPFALKWWYNFGDGKIDTNVHNPVHTFDASGNYTVSLNADYRICPDHSVSLTIQVNDFVPINLGADTAICPGVTSAIVLSNKLNSGLYTWSTGEVSNSITVTTPGVYWAINDKGGCETSDSVWVKNDCYISFPNTFSPNGDGLNDYFLARQLESMGVTKFNLSIHNRWGEQVFITTSLNGRGWDGKFGGKDQPVGTYVYYMDAIFRNGTKKSLQGNVTLLR
jgi:gliding motility-associated-like protein